jgi:Holliday junction DNA helicase RuvA
MISFLTGIIKQKSEKSATVLVGDVGYEVFLAQLVLEKLKIGETKDFFCHLHVREDAMELYGFVSFDEKKFFELLISVSGVGPKSAMAVLAVAKLSEIQKAILRGDPTLLRKVSGIGQKIAERVVVELKNKLESMPISGEKIDLSFGSNGAFEALQGLGYSSEEVRMALRAVPSEIEDENEIIKLALKNLGKKK